MEDIIRKVQKLLALAQSPNEHEAAAAAAKAQEILAEHGLEMAQIRQNSSTPSAYEPRTKDALDSSAMYAYQRDLMSAVARNNFCRHLIVEQPRQRGKVRRIVKVHVLIGSKVNVTVAAAIYDYLVTTMDRLLPWQGMEKRGKNALLWLAGCGDRLETRLDQQRRDQEQAHAARQEPTVHGGNQLVVLHTSEDDLNNDFLYGYEPGTTAARRAEREAMWAARATTVAVYEPTPETAKEKRKRESQERRWNESYARRQARFAEKFYSDAYQAGRKTADDISLNQQITKPQDRIGGK
jgi:hypothetical protein